MIDKFEIGKEKIAGKVKETVGQVTKDEGLEFAGKLQSITADFEEKLKDSKGALLGKANDFIDQVQEGKKDIEE